MAFFLAGGESSRLMQNHGPTPIAIQLKISGYIGKNLALSSRQLSQDRTDSRMNEPPRKPKKIVSERVDTEAPAYIVVSKFDGLTPFCNAMGYKTSTVWSWLESGLIPAPYHEPILAKAIEMKIDLAPADFVRMPRLVPNG